jgi:putative Holliday junction resolvase
MTIELIHKNIMSRPIGRALIGLDVGKKTIGIAISDPSQSVATPHKTIFRTKFSRDLDQIQLIIKDFEAAGFIIGYPLNMDGSESKGCQSIRDFALELATHLRLREDKEYWIGFWDERLSTASVHEFVDNVVDKKRKKAKEAGIIDKLAAQIILQRALDFIQTHPSDDHSA